MLTYRVLLICATIIYLSDAARILGIIPTPSYSHQVVFRPLWRELSMRGHQVTTLTTDPMNDQQLVNLTEIDLHFTYDIWNEILVGVGEVNVFEALHWIMTTLTKLYDKQLEHPEVQNLIRSADVKFDLVVVEYFGPSMFAFAQRFNCPFIGVTSLDAPGNILKLLGNPTHPVVYPNYMLPFSENLTLWQRVVSVVFSICLEVYINSYVYELEQRLVEKHFGSGYPSLQALAQNVSLLFINSDPIFHKVKPFLPNIVQIGSGSHRTAAKSLSEDLQKLLDDASHGFIYFSLGTNVKSKDIPEEILEVIRATFDELPYTILWKFELENLPKKPSNVVISKWFPQQDILKHPNIKLFITQGGLQSIDEAVYDHVPMVGIPFFGDQSYNVKKMVEKGFGLSLDHKTLEKEHFKQTILEVIENPKYRNKVKELAELASDQPMTGLERAVWWTEYVLRHNGAKHLRSPALDIPWYQYFLLDVIAVLALALTILFFILYVLIKSIVKIITTCCSKFQSKLKKH